MRWTSVLSILLLAAAVSTADDETSSAPADPHAGHDHGMMMPPHPMSMPPGGAGSIAIHVVQGTAGGPAIGPKTVSVELFGPDKRARIVQARLDEHGVAMLENLPLDRSFQPRVTVEHGGIAYRAAGNVMSPANASQKITVTVYETTDQPTDWDVQMWHVILHPADSGLHVTEMLAIKNHTDRAFVARIGRTDVRASVTLDLPPAATDIKMGGVLQPHNTTVADGRLTWLEPLTPGLSQLRVGYTLPTPQGRARITLTPPAAAKVLMVFVPHKFTQVHSDTLQAGEVYDLQSKPMRCYKATGLSAGKPVTLTISGLPHLVDRQDAASGSPLIPKIIAALGGGLMLVLCMVVLLYSPTRDTTPPSA